MSDKTEQKELRRVLEQMKREEQAEKRTGSGDKKTAAGNGKPAVEEKTGWKQEICFGLPAMLIDTVILYAGIYLFSLVYKISISSSFTMGQDSTSSITYYVNPIWGILGVLLLFLLKNVYDVRFFRIQYRAKKLHRRLERVTEWMMYVVFMLVQEVLVFAAFSCGRDFFDTYTFENASLGNTAYTVLYVLLPLLYPVQAIVRVVFKHIENRQISKKEK